MAWRDTGNISIYAGNTGPKYTMMWSVLRIRTAAKTPCIFLVVNTGKKTHGQPYSKHKPQSSSSSSRSTSTRHISPHVCPCIHAWKSGACRVGRGGTPPPPTLSPSRSAAVKHLYVSDLGATEQARMPSHARVFFCRCPWLAAWPACRLLL